MTAIPKTGEVAIRNKAAEAWRTLADAGRRIASAPGDGAGHIARIRALLGLGLRTLAVRECQMLIRAGAPAAAIGPLVEAAGALPPDGVGPDERETTLRANLANLPEHLRPSEEDLARWREEYCPIAWFRAVDGNIVRANMDSGRVAHLENIRGAAPAMFENLFATMRSRIVSPIIFEGCDPVWLLEALLHAPTPPTTPGFRPRLLVVQQDAAEFLNGLACANLGPELADERISWFIGSGATDRLRIWLADHTRIAPPECAIRSPLLRVPAEPSIAQVNEEAGAAWRDLHARLKRDVLEPHEPRDASYWAERFGSTDSLRVVVMTSRFSTYMRHASNELARELESAGHDALVLTEVDDTAATSVTYYLDEIRAFDPDLIVSINYPRSTIAGRVPPDVPFVCWVQDAMPHLFNRERGEATGPLDFVVGMVKLEMHRDYAYPKDRLLWLPMATRTETFTVKRRAERTCDIAWVTHHGASVEQLHERLTSDFREKNPDTQPALDTLRDRIIKITSDPSACVAYELAKLADEPLAIGSGGAALRGGFELLVSYIHQIAERAFRMEAARWAKSIAERRGWSLRFYGNGWDQNPEFADLAAGPVAFGADLAECYASAGVHLHASITQPLHQRVAECSLAGGLVLSRVPRDPFALLNNRAILEAIELGAGEPLPNDPDGRRVEIDRLPAARRMVDELDRLGLMPPHRFADGMIGWPGARIRDMQREDSPEFRAQATAFEALTGLFFANEQTLETLLDHALTDDAWRSEQIEIARSTLSETMTMRSFVDRTLGFIRDGLSAASESTAAAVPTR